MDVVIFLKRRRNEFLVGNMNSRGLFERVWECTNFGWYINSKICSISFGINICFNVVIIVLIHVYSVG